MALKAGGLGGKGASGIPDRFRNSMAQAIENALNDLRLAEGQDALSTANTTETRDRRMLFVAIAQGVVNHLVENGASFRIVDDDDEDRANHNIVIDRTGPLHD